MVRSFHRLLLLTVLDITSSYCRNYEFAQIDKYQKNEDGSLTITSEQEDPYMAFRTELLSE